MATSSTSHHTDPSDLIEDESPTGAVYRDEIESIRDETDFEAIGDERYLNHPDDEARLLWAFHRPSGSHPLQVGDPNPTVAIMAFNHSRLGAYERFTRLNPDVIADPHLRNKIRNRSRMLFRALVDSDFTELLVVLEFAPVFLDLACDQMVNGRIWNEEYADALKASRFLTIATERISDSLCEAVYRRLRPMNLYGFDEVKLLLSELTAQAQNLHPKIKEHYMHEFEKRIEAEGLHPLQAIVIRRQIEQLKDQHG